MNRSAPIYFYSDRRSLERIGEPDEHVILVGSYLGYANFGDILQLKGAIHWHRQRTRLGPIIICDVDAIHDADFINHIRRWFGVESIIFTSRIRLDLTALGLTELAQVPRVDRLHVYGGGFLNEFWGEGMLDLIESLHDRFGVGHYVLSGQQVGPEIIPRLREHFAQYPPLLAGGRDIASVGTLTSAGAHAAYSFDDAAEPLQAMAVDLGAPKKRSKSALIHLNLSSYGSAGSATSSLHEFTNALRKLQHHLDRLNKGDSSGVTLLQAYDDCRVDQIIDTLGVVQQLEHEFPFQQYQVVDLAALARDLWSSESPNRFVPVDAGIAIACSYHTTMFCGFIGVPCFLQTFNDYYRQKKNGLGLSSGNLKEFLENPQLLDLREPLLARGDWLTQLESVYERPSSNRAPVREWSPNPTEPIGQWAPKSEAVPQVRINRLREENARLIAEVNRLLEEWEQQKLRIQQLAEDRDRIWTDGQSRVKEMEQANIEMWAEVQRVASTWEMQSRQIQELAELKDRLWRELQELSERVKQYEQT